MTDNSINQYDTIELNVDLNPNVRKGMIGVILEKFSEEVFEIEVQDEEGSNIGYMDHYTFTVIKNQIVKKR